MILQVPDFRPRISRAFFGRAGYVAAMSRVVSLSIVAVAAVALPACASRAAAPHGPLEPGLEALAVEATALERPLHIVFDWRVRERDATFSGRGVARVQPPYRARLDLFGPRGEHVLAAGLVGLDLRLPGEPAVRLPPPALFWSALGVLHPPAFGELAVATRDSNRIRLEYAEDRDRWRFALEDDRLLRAEWDPHRAGRHTVELRNAAAYGVPGRAVYRDWDAFFELTLTVDEVEHVDPFPHDIWTPGTP
jgi:hypothetical protein